MIAGMASRANEDDRPAVVLYFSDFDPTGHQMPAHVSRKLQALRLPWRSEEHTSELQSPCKIVCRLLLVKKNVVTCLFAAVSAAQEPIRFARMPDISPDVILFAFIHLPEISTLFPYTALFR